MLFLCVYQKKKTGPGTLNETQIVLWSIIKRIYLEIHKPEGTFNLLDLDLNVFLSVYDMIQIYDF